METQHPLYIPWALYYPSCATMLLLPLINSFLCTTTWPVGCGFFKSAVVAKPMSLRYLLLLQPQRVGFFIIFMVALSYAELKELIETEHSEGQQDPYFGFIGPLEQTIYEFKQKSSGVGPSSL
jgi:hypothetical protein